jgi:hypothetical protein
LLQGPPILGGIALILFALPLIWNCVRLLTSPSTSGRGLG